MATQLIRRFLAFLLPTFLACLSTTVRAVDTDLNVQTEFGQTRVSPVNGFTRVLVGTEQVFEAPEYVYLNRNFVELDEIGPVTNVDDAKIAYYRAKIEGPVVNGATVAATTITGTKRSFVKTISEPTTVVWKWTLEYAVFFEAATTAGTNIAGAATAGNSFGNPRPALGRQWLPRDTQFSATVKRTITGEDAGGTDLGFRYVAKEYELENIRTVPAPLPDVILQGGEDYFWKFGGKTSRDPGYVAGSGAVLEFLNNRTTIAWWGKIDRKLANKRDQVFFQLLNKDRLNFPLRQQSNELDGEWRKANAMTFGVRPDGQLFVDEVSASGASYLPLVSVPAALVGQDWHHWAIDFDFPKFVSNPITSGTETIPIPFDFDATTPIYVFPSLGPGGPAIPNTGQLRVNVDYKLDPATRSLTLLTGPGSTQNLIGYTIYVGKKEIRIYRDGVRIANTLPLPEAYAFLEEPGLVRPASFGVGVAGPSVSDKYNAINLGFAQYHPAAVTDDFAQAPLEEELEGSLKDIRIWNGIANARQRTAHAAGDRTFVQNETAVMTRVDTDRIPRYSSLQNPPAALVGQSPAFVELLPFAPETREVIHRNSGRIAFSPNGEDVATENVIIDDWLRVRIFWDGQVRYRFGASGGLPGEAPEAFSGEAFVRYFDAAGNTVEKTIFSQGTASEAWIPLDRKVETGAFYRTFDRCFTVQDFAAGLGGDLAAYGRDISTFADRSLNDGMTTPRLRVARVADSRATSATNVLFVYQPTVFRAEVPLGQAFDPLEPNLQLIPALCDGAVLRAGTSGPDLDTVREFGIPALGTPSGKGQLRWDQAGKRLLPAQPGTFQVDWPDADGTDAKYKVEIVTGYPGDKAALISEREQADGRREGTAPAYVMETSLAPVAGIFPAAPGAHYRHHYLATAPGDPPTRLDLDPADNWKFLDLAFRDTSGLASVNETGAGVPFTAGGPGRSVVLYSYRENPDEIATGAASVERLAVRVVQSSPVSSILPEDPLNPVGRHGLLLGGGKAPDGAVGVIARGAAPPINIDPGASFVLDFWLNTKEVAASDGKAMILSTGANKLEVELNPEFSTITAKFFGLSVEQEFTTGGSGWTHYVIHVFGGSFFGVPVTVMDFYADGQRREDGRLTMLMPSGNFASFSVGPVLTATGLQFGAGADPARKMVLDQVRLYAGLPAVLNLYLDAGEIRRLRENRTTTLRTRNAVLDFGFESIPGNVINGPLSFANSGTSPQVGVGPYPGVDDTGLYASQWALLDLQEVATRLVSPLDNAGFGGGGYVLNARANYNPNLHVRSAEVGSWGPIYPVNDQRVFPGTGRRLEVAYYENPWLQDELSHPNVAWPWREAAYDTVEFPKVGPHKDKRIYIASRVGSEGVDVNGRLQEVYRAEKYGNLRIYNQPIATGAGYNPNEEHALTAPGNRTALKVRELGESVPNNPALAAFALQSKVNVTTGSGYTSEPWVLTQVDNLVTGEPEMAAYKVMDSRPGTLAFPRPPAGSGLTYDSASNPGDRILSIDPAGSYNFAYAFNYQAYAGDPLIPPYPLNLVIGNVTMQDARGRNVLLPGSTVGQRALWRDVNRNAWVVSGGGRFFHQFFYPFRNDFYLSGTVASGTPVAWVPEHGAGFTGADGSLLNPQKVTYDTLWRSNYPKLKRGETAAFQGGEYFNENPGANGLPAFVAMAAAEVVYDSATPSMLLGKGDPARYDVKETSARVVRPLDRREADFTTAQMKNAGFEPKETERIFVVQDRWYFKELPGSLQGRFYFDTLAQKLVLRGRLNAREGGNPDLTSGPDPVNLLEPNVLSVDDYNRIQFLSSDYQNSSSAWQTAINRIYYSSVNPNEANTGFTTTGGAAYLAGIKDAPASYPKELAEFWKADLSGPLPTVLPNLVPLDSFGVGAVLAPSPDILTRSATGSFYMTVAENNRTERAGAPVSLHIVEIIPDRYRGAIKLIEGADAFSEKVTLQHNGEFGGNTDDLYYEWWIRDAAPLDVVATEILADGTLKQTDAGGATLWQQYVPEPKAPRTVAQLNALGAGTTQEEAKHRGLHSIVFEGRPDVILADKLVLMRYRHEGESNWNLVPFEVTNPALAWRPGSPAPFQWAGAANSPQLQADGSKRYIPQLIMGWVKRVLDRINPYEARYNDFFNNESPATYSSQIQIAGAPYAGKVALNSDKSVIERTGLIELYETVLARAKELSIDNSTTAVSTPGINQALLLAATRLSTLYELLASEAYSDAQDSTISVANDSDLARVASYTHAFQNVESDLMHEELALLRGTDFRKSYPVHNRLFWNYAKGPGEAAYNVNYNIYDLNTDGFINEDDARKLYPQGHGDAWGHFVSSIGKHYTLLQNTNFSWQTRSELYALMDNVLEVDFLDEKTFARLAAGKARTGRDIVRGTYRLNYTQNPDGQWQGYTDGADPARAWGVSEWAHRAGQGALFDWAVANALMPADATPITADTTPENLDRIERSGAVDEIGGIAAGLYEIQTAMDEANGGVNPLGFDADTVTFDIDPAALADGTTHFEQIYERALASGNSALSTLAFATQAGNKLRGLGDATEALIVEAMRQDLDYRNRLIEIFGRPYAGTIGFGKAYPEGYEGPDTTLYAYMDSTTITSLVPPLRLSEKTGPVHFDLIYTRAKGIMDSRILKDLYDKAFAQVDGGNSLVNTFNALIRNDPDFGTVGAANLKEAFVTLIGNNDYELENRIGNLSLTYETASRYGFQAPPGWGKRSSYGRVQSALEGMLMDEISLDEAIIDYNGFLQDWEAKTNRIISDLEIYGNIEGTRDLIDKIRKSTNASILAAETFFGVIQAVKDFAKPAAFSLQNALPVVTGPLAYDTTSVARGVAYATGEAASGVFNALKNTKDLLVRAAEFFRDEFISDRERSILRLEKVAEVEGMIEELVNLSGSDQPKRDAIGLAVQALRMRHQEYVTAVSDGFRLLREREAFNKVLAAKAQKNRYQDMLFRLSRNEALSKYQTAFNHAARYTWLAAKAYDYETSLNEGHPAAVGSVLDKIVKERQLGLWPDGNPAVGQGGLGEILAQMNGNFQVLKGQLGLNNPQEEDQKISLRRELFRILPYKAPDPLVPGSGSAASDARWRDVLKARVEPDLNLVPEFVRFCRPFAAAADGAQPGLVIRFSTHIEPGLNIFGRPLAAGDHNYSTANFSTKLRSFGLWFKSYNDEDADGLATTPRGYLVPAGTDYMRVSTSARPALRMWDVVEQRIPTPYTINQTQLRTGGFIPTLNGVDGLFNELRRYGDFRIYHDLNGRVDEGGNVTESDTVDDSELIMSSRLIGRSVWNSEWLLIIPGAGLQADPQKGLDKLTDSIADIRIYFATYSHQGQ